MIMRGSELMLGGRDDGIIFYFLVYFILALFFFSLNARARASFTRFERV